MPTNITSSRCFKGSPQQAPNCHKTRYLLTTLLLAFCFGMGSAKNFEGVTMNRTTLVWNVKQGAYQLGSFNLTITGESRDAFRLEVTHQAEPSRILWESIPRLAFLAAAEGTAEFREHGLPEGSFDVRDNILKRCDHQSVTAIKRRGTALVFRGALSGPDCKSDYELTFEALSEDQLRFRVELKGQETNGLNRAYLTYTSDKNEHFFGFGEQLTYLDQKGRVVPILVQEHGVGRGLPIVTQIMNLEADGGGGNPGTTEAPAPHYLTSLRRSLFLENSEYSLFDLTRADRVEVTVFSDDVTGRILYGRTPLDLIEAYTSYAGRMRELPDWVHEGAVVAVQGGTARAEQKLGALNSAGVPLAGFWIQDWPGKRVTSVGSQLWWDWRLDEKLYPKWDGLVDSLAEQDARMLLYVNPFLTNAPGHDELFSEAQKAGYLVRQQNGAPYLIKNTDFYAGLVDLSNPSARTWIKGVIKRELIGKGRASGWMADFGEALPFDALLYEGADPAEWHNRYPEVWAQVNREAIEEAGRADDIVFFNRSGFTRSPESATLFWMGDQLQTWDDYDGLKSVVIGLQSGGISGFSLLHSDTGGYNDFSVMVLGKKVPVIARSKELLARWMELSAFTAMLRTHEGLDPSIGAQFDSDEETLAHLNRCARLYKALGFYRKMLVSEAAQRGYPLVRPTFLHYPDDRNTYDLRYQFMYGSEFLVAPVLDKGARKVKVYLPEGSWINLWTEDEVRSDDGMWLTVDAPLGEPGLFYKKGSKAGRQLVRELRVLGLL